MKHLLISAMLFLGAACTAPLTAPPVTIDIPVPMPAPPRPMIMLDSTWYVFVDDEDQVWIALKPKGYQSLILNFAEIERYIEQLELNDEYFRETINPKRQDTEEGSGGG